MISITVLEEKFTKPDALPSNMRPVDGMSLKSFAKAVVEELFLSDISFLYSGEGMQYVREIRKYSALTMFKDMKHFMWNYAGDMVVFYSKEIASKFGSDELAMDYLQHLKVEYRDMVIRRAIDDMLGRNLHQEKSKLDMVIESYSEEEVLLLQRIADEGGDCELWKDSISSPRELQPKGCIYIVEDRKGHLVKIGRSENPDQRINAIRTSSGRSIGQVFVTVPFHGYRKAETRIHKVLAVKRGVGEWFACSFDLAKKVACSVVEEFSQPDEVELKISELINRYNSDMLSVYVSDFMTASACDTVQ